VEFYCVTEHRYSVTFDTVAALIGASRCLAKLLLSGGFFVIRHP